MKSVKGGSCRFSVTQCCILFPPVPDIKASHPRKELRSAKRRANQTTRLCFSFYCLLTDYFYNMIMYGDKRLCLERQTHRSDCTIVLSERHIEHIALRHTGIEHFADRAFQLYIFEYEKHFFFYWNVCINAAAASEQIFYIICNDTCETMRSAAGLTVG